MHIKLPKLFKVIVAISIVTALIMLPMLTKANSTMKNDKDLTAQIDQMLTDTFKATEPGAAVIVVRNGQVILRKGYGLANLELGVPIAPEMVFRLGSITKQFTAVSILMLVEAGKVALSDDITKYLPDYPTHGQGITIEHLLTHTGGVKDLEFLPARLAVARQDLMPTELIALFKDEPLDFTPGTQWAYSNSGYILLGAIIEKVSGLSYADFIQQRIFTPLGMEHSYFDNPTRLIPGRVPGYARTEAGFTNAEFMSLTQPYAAGSLASSLDDLARWDAALYTDKLVKQATLQRAFQSATLRNGRATGYGYGWAIGNYLGHPISEHDGGINGFNTQMIRLSADKVYVAILTNCENCRGSLGTLAFKIAALAIGKPYQDPPAIMLPPTSLTTYTGIYQLNEQTSVVIRQEDDHLTLQAGGAARAITPLSATEFFIKDAPVRIKFVKNAGGVVTELQVQNRFGGWHVAQKSDQPLPSAHVAIQLDPAIYTQYVGEYQIAPGFSLMISIVGGKLFGQPSGEAKAELFAEAETRFFLTAVDAQIEFIKDAAGKVTDSLLTPDQYRDRLLGELAYPLSFLRRLKSCQCGQTTLVARGWWETLDWELYDHPCGYADSGATSTSTQAIGQGVTSTQIGHLSEDFQYYVSIISADFAKFKGGEQIIISGANNAENNQITTINTKLSPKQVYTTSGAAIGFDPANDIYPPDASKFVTKEMILITGSDYAGNNGYKWIKKVYVIHQDRLEIYGGGITPESGNPNVSITAGTTLRLDDATVDENPGAEITVKSLTQYICQAICNPCDEAWSVNHGQIKARTVGTPTDHLIIDLCTDCNTVVSTTTLDASAIIDRTELYDLYFPTPATMPVDGCLYLRVHRSGPVDMDNYYELNTDATDPRLISATISPDGVKWYDPANQFTLNAALLQDVEVTTQAQLMGQSWSGINNVFINTTLNYAVPVYRNGWRSIRYELERLIALGTPSGRRLKVTVDCDKNLIIDAEPQQDGGCLTINCNTGFPVDEHNNPYVMCAMPAGFWACPPAAINGACPDYEQSTFVEEWEMDYSRCRINYTSRSIDLDALGLVFKYQGIG